MKTPPFRRPGFSRRDFLCGAGAGLAASASVAALGYVVHRARKPASGPHAAEGPHPPDGMPGPFPGRVVEVHHPGVVTDEYAILEGPVADLVGRGMRALTGADHAVEAWRRLFGPGPSRGPAHHGRIRVVIGIRKGSAIGIRKGNTGGVQGEPTCPFWCPCPTSLSSTP